MDDDLQDFEAELKRLRPQAPSRGLAGRVERELGAAPAATGRPWWWLAALPAAAAMAFFVVARAPERAVPPAPVAPVAVADDVRPVLKPVAAENVLYAARDEGIVMLADGTAARRERWQYVDTITWKNPRTNASLKWSMPREEVRIVPVAFQ